MFVLLILLLVLLILLVLLVLLILLILLTLFILIIHLNSPHFHTIIFAVNFRFMQQEVCFLKIEFKKYLCKIFNITPAELDKLYSNGCFRGIRINTLKTDYDTVKKEIGCSTEKSNFLKDEYYIENDASGIGNNPLHHAGGYYVQEPSASFVLSAINALPGEKILDLCAAPGGKSTGIGAGLKGEGLLWANEYIRSRANILLSNIERMGISNAVVSSLDTEYLCKNLPCFFDKVLVDAPCSGEGMWRKNENVDYEWNYKNIENCVDRQRKILNSAVLSVKPGGLLIYSTCTYNTSENEENVEWFLNFHNDFTLEKIDSLCGRGGIGKNKEINEKVKRILPFDKGEGHFVALFKRNGANNAAEKEIAVYDNQITVKEFSDCELEPRDREIVNKFISDNFLEIPSGKFICKNSCVYLVPEKAAFVKGDILRYGLFVGTLRKNRLEPSHALYSAAGTIPKRVVDLKCDDDRVKKFLLGMEIESETEDKGYVGISVCGCKLGFGKQSGHRITNHYPKGLRIRE